VEHIFSTLDRLDIGFDVGPRNLAELTGTWSQHNRLALYEQCLQELRAAHVVYACTCTRTTLVHCRCASAGFDLDANDVAWRSRIPAVCEVRITTPEQRIRVDLRRLMADPVVRQRSGRPAYQIASLCDDLHFGVDLIVRGEDLLPSTACQLWMASVLGRNAFLSTTFIHHRWVLGPEGRKLSKTTVAAALHADALNGARLMELRQMANTLYAESGLAR